MAVFNLAFKHDIWKWKIEACFIFPHFIFRTLSRFVIIPHQGNIDARTSDAITDIWSIVSVNPKHCFVAQTQRDNVFICTPRVYFIGLVGNCQNFRNWIPCLKHSIKPIKTMICWGETYWCFGLCSDNLCFIGKVINEAYRI